MSGRVLGIFSVKCRRKYLNIPLKSSLCDGKAGILAIFKVKSNCFITKNNYSKIVERGGGKVVNLKNINILLVDVGKARIAMIFSTQ